MKILSIHLTDLCNSRCTFCVVGSPLYSKDTVNFEEILRFVKANSSAGYTIVNLHGGEPTIHPRFLNLLEYIQSQGFAEIHVQTNGLKLADATFVEKAKSNKVTRFVVSLHAAEASVQDSLTDTLGGWRRTITGIQNAVRHGIEVRTNTVITRQNYSSLEDITKVACDLGVSHLNYSNIQPVGSAFLSFSSVAPSFEEIREPLSLAIEHAQSRGRTVTVEGFPYCTISKYINVQLFEECREIRMLIRGKIIESYDGFMNSSARMFGPPCDACVVREKCGGVYSEYVAYRGWNEFRPITEEELTAGFTRDIAVAVI